MHNNDEVYSTLNLMKDCIMSYLNIIDNVTWLMMKMSQCKNNARKMYFKIYNVKGYKLTE